MRALPSRLVVVVLLLVTFPAGTAPGQEQVDISTLNDKAIELSQAGEYMAAIEIWFDLVDRAGPGYTYLNVLCKNVGRNFQKLGLNAEAWWYFERAVALGMDQDATLRGWLGEVEGALAETHVKVTLASDVPGTEVKFQHGRRERWYVMPLVWWFVPGTYLVPARVPGQKEISLKVVVEPRSEQLKFKLAATPGPGETPGQDGPTEKGAAPVVEPPPAGNGGLRWDAVPAWKWLLLGGAGLMGVGGAAFYLVASSNLDEQRDKHAAAWADETGKIPPKDQDAADADWQDRMDEHVTPYEVAGYVLLGAGGAAAVASALLICPDLTAGEEKARVVVLPLAIPGGGGALIEMAF